jgi:hypothetical protein
LYVYLAQLCIRCSGCMMKALIVVDQISELLLEKVYHHHHYLGSQDPIRSNRLFTADSSLEGADPGSD